MKQTSRAFSLLEMMVAIALLSLGLVLLLQVQARSIQLAQSAREITVATMLARGKILDCQADLLKRGFAVGDYNEEGDFEDETYPTFYWECHAYKPELPVADAGDIQGAMAGGPPTGATGQETPAAGGLAGMAGGAGAMGMSFIAPVLSQMSSILGDSIRELVVVVRWGNGKEMEEMTVTTHVIDKTAVNNVAGMIQQATGIGGNNGNNGNNGDPKKKPKGGRCADPAQCQSDRCENGKCL